MDSSNSVKKDILGMIKDKLITPEKGFELIQSIKARTTVDQTLMPERQATWGNKLVLKQQVGNDNEKTKTVRENSEGITTHGGDSGKNAVKSCEIAVIGMSGRFSGARNTGEFWANLKNGVDSVAEVPAHRWDVDKYYDPDPKAPDKTYCKWSGTVPGADRFDPLFFNISPREAEMMDPQHRLVLEESFRAIEDAGYSPGALSGKKCGVFIGVMQGDYDQRLSGSGLDTQSITGNLSSFIPARISYFLNLTGPNMAIDTACSSSLVAVHQGCQSIINGESEIALAGGVCIQTTPTTHISIAKGEILSRTGRCRTFDNNADGFVPGEGVAVVMLKTLAKAIKDRDHIYGVIKGSGINQDGKTNGITAPSGNSQAQLEMETYDTFGINPENISYVEAHGTGTKLGDPIEVSALTRAFRKYTVKKQYCAIGSVKTNIGHALAAAGVAGLIKVLLCMKHGKLVPSLHFNNENEHINFQNSPFYVPIGYEDWKKEKGPRVAAISSFGLSGTNCHMVLEEAPSQKADADMPAYPYYIIPLSAKIEAVLKQKTEELYNWLKNEGDQYQTGHVSYTLSVGRSHFAFRQAMVIKDIDDLKKTIMELRESGSADNCVMNNLKQNPFKPEPALVEFGKQLMIDLKDPLDMTEEEYRKKLMALADLYVKGFDPDWNILYEGRQYKRISLPPYPFSNEHYWLPIREEPVKERIARLHPMIGANKSTLKEQRFITEFTGEEYYLKDHVINGQKVLPGAAYIEMGRAACEIAGEKRVHRIKGTMWVRPLTIMDGPQEVCISLFPSGQTVEYEVFTPEEGQRVTHARGKIYFEEHGAQYGDEFIDIESAKGRCSHFKSGSECYGMFGEIGLKYGPGFQPIIELYGGGPEALALLELPAGIKGEFKEYVLHPTLMDGAFQTVAGMAGSAGETSALYLPFTLGEVEIKGSLPEKVYAYVSEAGDKTSEGSGVKKYDIRITDEDGRVLVKMNSFSLRAYLPQDTDRNVETVAPDLMYFKRTWEKAAIDHSPVSSQAAGHLLVFDTGGEMQDALRKFLLPVLLVKPGPKYRKLENMVYEINPEEYGDYLELIRDLQSQGKMPSRIIHRWSQSGFIESGEETKVQLDRGIYSLVHLFQALMELKVKGELKVMYVYPEIQPLFAAVSGFARTARQENPRFQCKTIEVAGEEVQPLPCEAILREFDIEAADEVEVRFEDGQRYVRRLVEIDPGNVLENELPLKEKGVYLITGGAGELGLIFAEYLARKVRARLVLSGRSDLSAEKNKKIRELELLGSEIVYIKSDVSHREEVQALVSKAKSHFKEINGVIHGAGVIKDSFLIKKSREDMKAVLAPKVYGTFWLDEATREEPIEFFVMLSSIASVTGNPGQSDYAFGNGFMDRFAGVREAWRAGGKAFGKALSINWPLWKEGGMRPSEHVEAWMIKKIGLISLNKEDGLRAFERALSLDIPNVLVLAGQRQKVYKLLGIQLHAGEVSNSDYPPQTAPVQSEEMMDTVKRDLVRLCSELLKVKESDIDTDEDFSSYGMDSIMMMEMTNRIESLYGEVIEPNAIAENNTVSSLAGYLITQEVVKAKEVASRKNGGPVKEVIEAGNTESVTDIPRVMPARDRFEDVSSAPAANNTKGKIAVVGMACRFPKAGSPELFWDNLVNGRSCFTEVPEDRWSIARYFSPDKNELNKSYSKWGGFIDNIYFFDAGYFGINDDIAMVMDPQQRILLELTQELLCHAGYSIEEVNNSRTGVFIGGGESVYLKRRNGELADYMKYVMANMGQNMMATRISDFYNLKGPSLTIDTACSSALVAIHQACQSIRCGESEMAIAGGIELLLDESAHVGFSKAGVLSEDCLSYVFDERANGFVLGEGAGLILLKSYDAAVRDNDQILGVIQGSAVNNDGHTMGLTVPSMEGQKEVIRQALENSGISADTITYLETHGTGTLLGDPIEIRAATQMYREFSAAEQKCAVGSVKSNIGHLLRAAGVASFIKVILALQKRVIPPTLNCFKPHPRFRFENSPFYPVAEAREWLPGDGVRRAAISSFGFGGTNCHIILEQFSGEESAGYVQKRHRLPLPIFKRKQYCIGREIVGEHQSVGTQDREYFKEVLDSLENGSITISKALDMINNEITAGGDMQ